MRGGGVEVEKRFHYRGSEKEGSTKRIISRVL